MPYPIMRHAHIKNREALELFVVLCIITAIMSNQILIMRVSTFSKKVLNSYFVLLMYG